MKRPDIMNLQALIKNIGLNSYQKALAFSEFDKLIDYTNYLEANFNNVVLGDVVLQSEQLIAFQNFLILDSQLDLQPDDVKRNAEIFLGN